MKTSHVAFLFVLGLAVVAVACGDEDLLGGNDGGTSDSGMTYSDTGATADSGVADDSGGTEPAYRFVRIEDNDTEPSGEDPGADIDAIGLIKGTAEEVYAGNVATCEDASATDGVCENETAALDEPDAFPNLPVLDECEAGGDPPAFVSLGGEGGFIVVEMTADLESGDTLNVYELGNCTVVSGGNTAKAEPISVSIATSAAGPWVDLTLEGDAPMYSATIP